MNQSVTIMKPVRVIEVKQPLNPRGLMTSECAKALVANTSEVFKHIGRRFAEAGKAFAGTK